MSSPDIRPSANSYLARHGITDAIAACRARDASAEDKLWLIRRHVLGTESDATCFAVTVNREDAAIAAKALLAGTLTHIAIRQHPTRANRWQVLGAWREEGEQC